MCFLSDDGTKKTYQKIGDIGIARVRQAVADRKKYNDHANWDTVERIYFNNVAMNNLNHKDVIQRSPVICI